MSILLVILAVTIIGFSLYGVLYPRQLTGILEHFTGGSWLWFAAGFRLVLAVALWFSAPVSRTPEVFRIIACLAILGAVLLVVVPNARLKKFVDTLSRWPSPVISIVCVLGIALGSFFIWSSRVCACFI
jgi:hypothetical protein